MKTNNNNPMKGTEKKYSKFYLYLKSEDNEDEKWQEVIRINPPSDWDSIKRYGKDIVDKFNASLRPGERKRILIKVLNNQKPGVKLY